MTISATQPTPRSSIDQGVRRVITLAPVALKAIPMVAPQAELDLSLDSTPELPPPSLRMVVADDRALSTFAARFAQAVVEVIAGDRGVHQLMRWTTESVYADLLRRVNLLQGAAPGDQRLHRLRAQVRSVHLSQPRSDTAEISVHVRHGQRSRAIAARLEHVENRWRCTVLNFG